MPEVNEFGQLVGDLIAPPWTPREPPGPVRLEGRYVVVEPLTVDHAPDLHDALCATEDRALWTYRSTQPPRDVQGMVELVQAHLEDPTLVTFALVPRAARRRASRRTRASTPPPGRSRSRACSTRVGCSAPGRRPRRST